MIYKYKSIKSIIDGIYRDYDSPNDLDIWDIVEWCGEALELIGAGIQYRDLVGELTITNHTAILPANFNMLDQISYLGQPLRLNTATVTIAPSDTESTVDSDEYPMTGESNTNTETERYYIKAGCIVTSFESGTIMIAYKGTEVDSDGYPMIPDNVYYDKALKSYAQTMLDRKEWRKGNLPEAIYRDSQRDWLFYVKAAASSARMPNKDMMENIKNNWARLKPNPVQYNSFFANTGTQERLNL